jgi:hypothetical protein
MRPVPRCQLKLLHPRRLFSAAASTTPRSCWLQLEVIPKKRWSWSVVVCPLSLARCQSASKLRRLKARLNIWGRCVLQELDRCRRELSRLAAEKHRTEQLLTSVSAQNWDRVLARAQALRAQCVAEMDRLVEEVSEVCEETKRQKQASFENAHPVVGGAVAGAPPTDVLGDQVLNALPSPLWRFPLLPTAHFLIASFSLFTFFKCVMVQPKRVLATKSFQWRESQLSVLLRQPNFRTIYHIFVSILLLFTAKILLNEYLAARDGAEPFQAWSLPLLVWNFGGFTTKVVPLWYVQHHKRITPQTATHFRFVCCGWLQDRDVFVPLFAAGADVAVAQQTAEFDAVYCELHSVAGRVHLSRRMDSVVCAFADRQFAGAAL